MEWHQKNEKQLPQERKASSDGVVRLGEMHKLMRQGALAATRNGLVLIQNWAPQIRESGFLDGFERHPYNLQLVDNSSTCANVMELRRRGS
jgi:hypothetical protein